MNRKNVSTPICERMNSTMDELKRSGKIELIPSKADEHFLLHAIAHLLTKQPTSKWNYNSLKTAIKTESKANKSTYAKFVDKNSRDMQNLIDNYIDDKHFDQAAVPRIPLIISNVAGQKLLILDE